MSATPTTTRHPVQRVGVIGGGQLAWMMAPGAAALDLELLVQTPTATDPATAIAAETLLAPIADTAATAKLASRCDVITFENEFIDLPGLQALATAGKATFFPPLHALAPLLDKAQQRSYCQQLGFPTPPFVPLTLKPGEAPDPEIIKAALAQLGVPVVLKTCRHGYDGQGTFILHTQAEVVATWQRLEYQPILLEGFVPFQRELAIMVARSQTGDIATYPVVETQQVNQVCRRVIAPAPIDDEIAATIETMARSLMASLDAVGIFGIELFLTAPPPLAPGSSTSLGNDAGRETAVGSVLINEIAPRTHNSGHYSLDACATSQFEQQLRSVTGHPLGATELTCHTAVMVNLLGFETSTAAYQAQRHQLQQLPNSHVYWYDKPEARPGRKLGHVTVTWDSASQLKGWPINDAIAQIESIWYPPGF